MILQWDVMSFVRTHRMNFKVHWCLQVMEMCWLSFSHSKNSIGVESVGSKKGYKHLRTRSTWWGLGRCPRGCYSCRGPGFNSQESHDGWQPPVIPVPKDLMFSSGSGASGMHLVPIKTFRLNIHIHKLKIKYLLFIKIIKPGRKSELSSLSVYLKFTWFIRKWYLYWGFMYDQYTKFSCISLLSINIWKS